MPKDGYDWLISGFNRRHQAGRVMADLEEIKCVECGRSIYDGIPICRFCEEEQFASAMAMRKAEIKPRDDG